MKIVQMEPLISLKSGSMAENLPLYLNCQYRFSLSVQQIYPKDYRFKQGSFLFHSFFVFFSKTKRFLCAIPALALSYLFKVTDVYFAKTNEFIRKASNSLAVCSASKHP